MSCLVAFHYRSYGTFFYTQKGSIISTVVLPTTEIIEPVFAAVLSFSKNRLTMCISRDRIIELSLEGLVSSGMKKSFEKVLTSPSEDD
ncbi:hypothetical protein ACTGWL_11655, partial [Streptococcus suis]